MRPFRVGFRRQPLLDSEAEPLAADPRSAPAGDHPDQPIEVIRGTVKDPRAGTALNGTIRIGDVTVRPGDLVVGDVDGVVALPAADAEDVLRRSAERDRHEESVIQRIRAGETTLSIYGLPAEED